MDFSPQTIAAMDGETLLKTLQDACTEVGASDIHVSPQKKDVRLEWRVHGVLQEIGILTKKQYEDLARRVKFEAKLKLNLTSVPQDGQYTFTSHDRVVNVRVATLPSRFGEAYTLRLLDPKRGILPLDQLGFVKEIKDKLDTMVQMPQGMIIVTGPTGSGKTTTLYALLSTLVGKERNIITLEDPVEYELEGIIQSQIDPSHDYSFASGLRSVLRHDPDVILVGEIRDLETAQTAVNAALTGHLVLSTLHTNSAIETIPRLLSMGVSPYTLAPALRGILAQRLVRTLTDDCRKEGATCDPSDHKSYGGQMSIAEFLEVTPEIQESILSFEQAPSIEAKARKKGFATMKEWGELAVKHKLTTKEEVERVLG
jgi:general secretion pathway protein E